MGGGPAAWRSVPAADLHVHSSASDGTHPPEEVVALAARAGVTTLALTDHDTLAGVAGARTAADPLHLRVIAGCEFSVAASWGEMHLLAYFLPTDNEELADFLEQQRVQRTARMREIVRRLAAAGAHVRMEDVVDQTAGGAVGRPHAARALVKLGRVSDVGQAFDRYLGRGRAAFVPKVLPKTREVTTLVRRLGGVTAAAHLRSRLTRPMVERLRDAGVDAIEVRHPAHDTELEGRALALALALGMLRTGGSDWHGEDEAQEQGRAPLGAITVPMDWVAALDALHQQRVDERGEA